MHQKWEVSENIIFLYVSCTKNEKKRYKYYKIKCCRIKVSCPFHSNDNIISQIP